MNERRGRGFTLVELLVVIAIIGILISLLLPAIQASRESARRGMCTNNMRQLIVAVHDYESAHEYFPAGTVDPTGPIQNLPNGHHISWIARILPYMEESAVYANLDPALSAYHFKNDRARQATIEVLICPSCPVNEWPYTNYAGCHHDVEAPIDVDNRGVFFLNSRITRDDLKDGAAYTLFLGEKAVDDFDLGWLSGTSSTLRNTGSPLSASSRAIAWGAGIPPWVYSYPVDGDRWQWDGQKQVDPISGEMVELEESTQPPPKVAAANTDPALTPDSKGYLPHSKLGGNSATPLAVGGFASRHVGGVNFALGDGSVRFIADDVSAPLMGRLANRADGQIINAHEW